MQPNIFKITALSLASVVAIAIIISTGFYLWQKNHPAQVACTQEAKQCPDGSYVGRTGPNCEFAPCPSEALCEGGKCPASGGEKLESGMLDTSNWKTYRNDKYGFEVKYPTGWQFINNGENEDSFIIGPIPSPRNEAVSALEDKGEIRIEFVANPNNISLDDAAKANRFYSVYKKDGEIEIAGIKAYKFVPKAPDPIYHEITYYLFKDKKNEIVHISTLGSIFSEVIPTFKFIQ